MPLPRALSTVAARPVRAVLALLVVALLIGGLAAWGLAGRGAPSVDRTDQMLDGAGVRLDTSLFLPPGAHDAPAVLLAHGFGGSKDDVRGEAEELARHGYLVLTYTARGFGKSTGLVGLNAPEAEVADASRLLDWLATRPEVRLDGPGDPRVGVAGGSYGGALALLLAGHDRRVDAIAPRITYWDLQEALFPGGVYKKQWAGILFTMGGGCARFEPAVCEMYTRIAQGGALTDGDRALLAARSPRSVGGDIRVPTYLAQGTLDSLFPLDHADAAQQRIAANGAPVAVDWIAGGHDAGTAAEDARVDARTLDWFDRYLRGDSGAPVVPGFQVSRSGGVDTETGERTIRSATTDRYPGLGGSASRTVTVDGAPRTAANPAGGTPASISSIPGLGALASSATALGASGITRDLPAQVAAFDSAPLGDRVTVTGRPTVTVHIRSTAPEAVLFAKLYDVGPEGATVLPQQLAAPIRVPLPGGEATVTVPLPVIDHEFAARHRMQVAFATTDMGYLSPLAPADYTITVTRPVTIPEAPGLVTAPRPLPTWVWALPLAALAIAIGLVTVRRRTVRAADPDSADVALQVTGLSKKYAGGDGYSVQDVTFRVDRGQVLGLLGPNGAGKTTTLRMLMGLITPDEGGIRVFGHPIAPGAPVLSRIGAFVEGAGFLPHLSGRANLDLYWRATGRPATEAHLDEALAIADLGTALERPVRTYSQGMRQRLAIAQAMLGLPDVLVLDEPTNGLDPHQILQMREAIVRYGATGRTVIVSSHLLSEVEQTCTHVVVLRRGRLIAAGTVDDVVATGGTNLEDAFLQLTGDGT